MMKPPSIRVRPLARKPRENKQQGRSKSVRNKRIESISIDKQNREPSRDQSSLTKATSFIGLQKKSSRKSSIDVQMANKSNRKLPTITPPTIIPELVGYNIPFKEQPPKQKKIELKNRSQSKTKESIKTDLKPSKTQKPQQKLEEFPQLFENGEFYDVFYLELMKNILSGKTEQIKESKRKSNTRIDHTKTTTEDQPNFSKKTSVKSALKAIDLDPFCQYAATDTIEVSTLELSSVPITPLQIELHFEFFSSQKGYKPPINQPKIRDEQTLTKRKPIKVRTYFGKGMEFRLFRYFYKVGEWVWTEKPHPVDYVHFTREEWVDWSSAKSSVVD